MHVFDLALYLRLKFNLFKGDISYVLYIQANKTKVKIPPSLFSF